MMQANPLLTIVREQRERIVELERENALLEDEVHRLTTQGANDDTPDMITVKQAMHLLGVSDKTIYKAVKKGALPGARKIAGAIRIDRHILLDWFKGTGVPTPAQGKGRNKQGR